MYTNLYNGHYTMFVFQNRTNLVLSFFWFQQEKTELKKEAMVNRSKQQSRLSNASRFDFGGRPKANEVLAKKVEKIKNLFIEEINKENQSQEEQKTKFDKEGWTDWLLPS